MRTIDDLREAGVHSPGEATMVLDGRAQGLHRRILCRRHGQHRMRIAHRDGADLNLLARDIETITVSLLRRVEWQAAWLEARGPHVNRHLAVCLDARVNESRRTVHRDRTGARLPAPIKEGCD